VKSCLSPRRACGVSVLGLLLLFSASAAPTKLIRLRNQPIPPKAAKSLEPIQANSLNANASGLFLIQFTGPVSGESRQQLAALGVDLLHYVPDDTFVARLRSTRLTLLRTLPFVQWIGEYRPEHKLHRNLSAKTISKSSAQSLDVTVLLVPRANSTEIATARGSFAAVRQQSTLRSGTILRGKINSSQLDALSRSETVLWIEPYHPMRLVDEVSSKIVAGDGGPNVLLSQSLGYDGSGVKVAVADSGLNNGDAASMHPDLLGRTPAFFYYGNLTDAADEHSHGTHVSGIIAGDGATGEKDDNGFLYGLGVAPGASIIAQRIFDGVGNFEPPAGGFEQLTRDATGAGAVIGSNSWGDDTQGAYDASAMEFDELVRDANSLTLGDQQYILEFSAGNAGPAGQTIGSPAVAKNVIATGASENDRLDFLVYEDGPEAMADFSSRGPCADGRIKPDIVAPGTWISSLQSASASDIYAWAPIDENYQYQGGTSQAGPHASGAAAVLVQFYRRSHTNATPSPALVKAALINTAVDMDDAFGTGPIPNNDEGWGRIDLTPLFDSSLKFDYLDQSVLLTNSQVFERRLVVASADRPLKVTLTYTDVPGFPGAAKALVNDLDLEVVGPGGILYRGNQIQNGESIPNASNPDSLNNVECVILNAPIAGQYVIRVRARSVQQDSRQDTFATDQDFALVTSADLAAPGQGIISFDHSSYRVPAKIGIIVTDTDLAGHANVSVLLKSTTEAAGETILLQPFGSSGVFTGAMTTATGQATPDGKLQISNGDTIEANYLDASANQTRIATAVADFTPPVLTGITSSNDFGQETISWTSSEPASSLLFYGTNPVVSSLTFSVSNAALTTSHTLSIGGLVAGRTYYFCVVSTDEAGNTATNNNSGALFSFVAPAVAPLLMIDEYTDPVFGVPPLSGYTNALNQVGIKYDVWIVANRGEPTFNTLHSYRAVVWRVPELTAAWSSSEQSAISNYLHTGGSLLVSSMEILSRLEEAGATNFTHQVLQVQSYIVDPDSTGAAEIVGSQNETVGNGLDITMDYTVYEDLWGGLVGPDLSDTMTPAANASPVLRNDFGDVVGLRWPAVGNTAPGRLVFFTFPLDAVPIGPGVNDRINLMRNALSFLAPGASGLGTVALDSPAYQLPATVTVEVGDSDLAGQGALNITATSTTEPGGLSVTLRETVNQGDFIGTFNLIASTNPPTAGKLRAKDGDTLQVNYFDASVGQNISATAAVDTMPPTISAVSAEPDYQQALILWSTSEPADSLVEFGESTFLGRTSYNPNLVTSHAVELDGLAPDQTYYYRVVSRDAAGNTKVSDNNGQLYAFHTLLPLLPPWSDNMNTGATNWSVVASDGSQTEWTLGVPNNTQETSAHSPPAAWGSNLNGDAIDTSETFLISPAIELIGGNSAKLHFWHSYDFLFNSDLDILNEGNLLLITNNATTPITLAQYSDDSTPGWIEETIDLTPFVGQVIYLVWDYEFFTFDTRAQAGWLVDDVSVSITNVQPGTVQITNSIWQANYILSGPVAQKAKGRTATITNAPPGQYVINFGEALYYQTPPPQTNNLVSGGTITFTGNYTFTDVNGNGIPDAWELQYFGNVSSGRTAFTDTDGDGMTDLAEFIAGTDPNNPPRRFPVTARKLSSTTCRLEWSSVPAVQYRVQSSSNLVSWVPYTGWLEATSAVSRVDVPMMPGLRSFFRIEQWTTASAAGQPRDLRISAQRLSNGTVNITWNSVAGRGYRVEGSTNGSNWTPVSNWMLATTATTTYSLPSLNPNFRMFRVQVQP
jgi:Subtilase family/Bacterial TSP3 repeat